MGFVLRRIIFNFREKKTLDSFFYTKGLTAPGIIAISQLQAQQLRNHGGETIEGDEDSGQR
jgi:hypothetical protein